MKTPLTELVGTEHPIVGFNRSPAVVAEVSRSGGLGVLAASAFSADELDAQLRWITDRVDGKPFGVDLLVPNTTPERDPDDIVASLRAQIPQRHRDFVASLLEKYGIPESTGAAYRDDVASNLDASRVQPLLDVCFNHNIALIANALGTPPPSLVERAKAEGVVVAALVGKREHARRQVAAGVDLLIAQGYEAGGHTGEIGTMVLTPDIIDVADGVPVLAAGGIASGRQMAAALALGAAGVWLGSVWLSSDEDVAPDFLKEKFLAASSSDTLRSKTRTGKPARQLRTVWHDEWDADDAPAPLPMPLQPMLVGPAWKRIEDAASNGNTNAVNLESFYIGQVVGSFRERRSTAAIVADIVRECDETLVRLGTLASANHSAATATH